MRRMVSQDEPARNGPWAGNFTLRSRGGPINQEGEEVEEVGFPSPGLISLNNSSHGHGKAELQGIYWSFCSWLEPDTHSEQEMISHLALEQFLLHRPSSERAAWKEKWESSGRDMEAFMEDLGDEGLRPPSLGHVSMEGQEALFSENMPLRQVLAHLQEQRSAAAPMALTPGTPWPTAPGDADENGDNLSSPDHQPPPCSSCRERALRAPRRARRCPGRVHAAPVQQVRAPPPTRKSLPKRRPGSRGAPRSCTGETSVPGSSGTSLGSSCTRGGTTTSGPSLVPHAAKASSRPRTCTCTS